jgi:hypothetical protein
VLPHGQEARGAGRAGRQSKKLMNCERQLMGVGGDVANAGIVCDTASAGRRSQPARRGCYRGSCFNASRWYYIQNREKCRCNRLIFRRLRQKPRFFGAFIAFNGLIFRLLHRICPIIYLGLRSVDCGMGMLIVEQCSALPVAGHRRIKRRLRCEKFDASG